MALVLDDTNKKLSVDFGFDEMFSVVDKDYTYSAVIEYWKFCKFVYEETVKDGFIKKEEIHKNILPLLNAGLYYDWHSKSILLGEKSRIDIYIPTASDDLYSWKNAFKVSDRFIFSDIKMNMFFSKNSFYTKLMIDENTIDSDVLEIKKYLKRNLKNKIRNMRAKVVKRQAANEIGQDHLDLVDLVKKYKPRYINVKDDNLRKMYMLIESAESNHQLQSSLKELNFKIPSYNELKVAFNDFYFNKAVEIMVWYSLNTNEEIKYNSRSMIGYQSLRELWAIFSLLSSGIKVNLSNDNNKSLVMNSTSNVDGVIKLFSKGIDNIEELEQNLLINKGIQVRIQSIIDGSGNSFINRKISEYLDTLKHPNYTK